MSGETNPEDERHLSADRETVQQWANRHDMVPVRATSTGADTETIQFVHESAVTDDHEQVEWDVFHEHLGEEEYVVIYHGESASEPLEVVSHDEAATRSEMEQAELRDQLLEGETVTSTVRETTVVETVVVEEATVESELVGREIIDEQVVDTELLSRDCSACELVPEPDASDEEWFDHDRYLASLGRTRRQMGGAHGETGTTEELETAGTETEVNRSNVERSFPYSAELEIEEAWMVTRELTERDTVESRVTDTEVTEADTIEDHDIDVEGLQQTIVQEGILEVEHTPEEVMSEFDVQSELVEGDRIRTHFDRTRVVEDDVVDRIRGYADITSADLTEMDIALEQDIATETTTTTGADTSEQVSSMETGRATLTEEDVGKDVVDADGKKVGSVERIEDDGRTVYVEAHTGLAERIMSALDWGDKDEHENRIYAGQIATVTDDEVRLKPHEELEDHRKTSGSD